MRICICLSLHLHLPGTCTLGGVCKFVCLFGLMFYIPVNSYGHVETVSLPLPHFFLSKVNSTLCKYYPSRISGLEENDSRNYFMIKFHESMGPARIEIAMSVSQTLVVYRLPCSGNHVSLWRFYRVCNGCSNTCVTNEKKNHFICVTRDDSKVLILTL